MRSIRIMGTTQNGSISKRVGNEGKSWQKANLSVPSLT
jgi:hypothetical protein